MNIKKILTDIKYYFIFLFFVTVCILVISFELIVGLLVKKHRHD